MANAIGEALQRASLHLQELFAEYLPLSLVVLAGQHLDNLLCERPESSRQKVLFAQNLVAAWVRKNIRELKAGNVATLRLDLEFSARKDSLELLRAHILGPLAPKAFERVLQTSVRFASA